MKSELHIQHRYILYSLLIACWWTLSGCEKGHRTDCMMSSGKETLEFRFLDPVNRLHISDNVDVVIHPASAYNLKVTAGQNLLSGIITERSGNTLYIRNENKCNWVRKFSNRFTVDVFLDTLEHIYYTGSGRVSFADTLHMFEFTFDCWNGTGTINFLFDCEKTHINNNIGRPDIYASGRSNVSFVYMSDVGIFDGSSLRSELCYIHNRSTGHSSIWVEKELEAIIEYTGNIYYSGNPYRIESKLSSSGRLIKK